ncbi:hypothetical protein Q8W71_29555 [Methylobacterium sp. NEAU 140]|uniref:DUF6894 family protein n=1 Tax=Methylobacterium sp. NEAU 140 TaxID=3064945 RepID=UPI002733E4CD|nr:hypothetical protein [Methylobacterium sp. NEAU 140]MDP4026756.1 hypothetical protein [Methylobacterium sp. NEAU 140]
MPRFHFHLLTPDGLERDEDGLAFADLDAAYLQAYATIPALARELLKVGRDPLGCAFVIVDEAERRLLEVPFRERIRGGSGAGRGRPVASCHSERAQDLVESLRRERALLRENLDRTRAILAASRAHGRGVNRVP